MKRWKAFIIYTPERIEDRIIDFNEYNELGEEIELGVDWRLIDVIQITLNK